jgi:hypothetical protein
VLNIPLHHFKVNEPPFLFELSLELSLKPFDILLEDVKFELSFSPSHQSFSYFPFL